MAPEQVLGERPVRPQADIYAMGAVLYEMLAGSRPFADSAPAAMLAKRLTEGSPLISVQHPDVPTPIALLIRDTLEVDPARRPANGAALAQRLQEAGSMVAPPPTAPVRSPHAGSRRVLAALGILLIAGAAAFFMRRTQDLAEPTIGVLPFENRSGDSAQAYLSEGVSDELTARLSTFPELRVSPRRMG